MTITILPARNEFTAAASQTVFTYTFKIFEDTDINVFVTPAGQDADDSTDQVTPSIVTGVGDPNGGTVTIAATSLGDLVTLVSDIPANRTIDYQNNGDFRPTVVNSDFDRVVSLVKQVEDVAGRSLVFPESQQNTQQLSLPTPVAGELLRWNSVLSGLENVNVSTPVETTLNSVAALRNLDISGLSSGTAIFLNGYFVDGDGGGGPRRILFKNDPPGTHIDNGGDIIVSNGGNGSAAWLAGVESMTLKEFGGKTETSFDNTDAMERAMASGLKIKPETGTFEHLSTIVWADPSEWEGIFTETIFLYTGSGTGHEFLGTDDNLGANPENIVNNLKVSKINFKTTSGVTGFDIQWFSRFGVGRVVFTDCIFDGWSGEGVFLFRGDGPVFQGCQFFNNRYGVHAFQSVNTGNVTRCTFHDNERGFFINQVCSNWWIDKSNFYDHTGSGVYCFAVDNPTIDKCTFNRNDFGVTILENFGVRKIRQANITNNLFGDMITRLISVDGSEGVRITGNLFYFINESSAPIRIVRTTDVVVTGNDYSLDFNNPSEWFTLSDNTYRQFETPNDDQFDGQTIMGPISADKIRLGNATQRGLLKTLKFASATTETIILPELAQFKVATYLINATVRQIGNTVQNFVFVVEVQNPTATSTATFVDIKGVSAGVLDIVSISADGTQLSISLTGRASATLLFMGSPDL